MMFFKIILFIGILIPLMIIFNTIEKHRELKRKIKNTKKKIEYYEKGIADYKVRMKKREEGKGNCDFSDFDL